MADTLAFPTDSLFVPEPDDSEGLVFHYTQVSVRAVPKDSPCAFPVYVVLRARAIDFYCHASASGIDPAASAISDHAPHQRILHLPLSLNLAVKDDLSHVLGRCATEEWPLGDGQEQAWEAAPPQGYAAQPCWLQPGRRALGCLDHPLARGTASISLGRLVLDFLFCLKHTTVFRHSPRYDGIETGLLQCPVANALHDKAEYHWQMERCEVESRYQGGLTPGFAEEEVWNAETEWLRACTADDGAEVLARGKEWFLGVEDEVRSVVFYRGRPPGACAPHERPPTGEPPLPLAGDEPAETDPHSHQAPTPCKPAASDWAERTRWIAGWWLRRYDLDAALLMLLRRPKPHRSWTGAPRSTSTGTASVGAWLGVLLAFACGAVYTLAHLSGRIPAADLGQHAGYLFPPLLALLLACIHFRRRRQSRSPIHRTPMPARPFSLILGVFLAVVWGVLLLADLGGLENRTVVATGWGLLNGLCVAVPLLASAGVVWLWKRGALRFTSLLLVIRLGLPRVLMTVTTTWVVVMAGPDEILKTSLLVGWGDILWSGVPLLVITLLFATIEISRRTGDLWQSWWRALSITFYCFALALLVGFLFTNTVLRSAWRSAKYLDEPAFLASAKAMTADQRPLPSLTNFAVPYDECDLQGVFRVPRDRLSAAPRALQPGVSTGGPDRCWTSGELRKAQLSQLYWGVPGAPLAPPALRSTGGIRVVYQNPRPLWRGSGDPWELLPGVLLHRAFICVFLALFLQLIFDEKPVTEPL
ncbi:MAG TPA: hypothetical protein PKJ98_11385 [Verrucomicrobiota bacterium]|nr:hypothetical protein [Verrucomicrobiota bacterium]